MDQYSIPQIYSANQHLSRNDNMINIPEEMVGRFIRFIKEFKTKNTIYFYKDHLISNFQKNLLYFECRLDDLIGWDSQLSRGIQERPNETIPLFERALKEILCELISTRKKEEIPDIQFTLINSSDPRNLRDLNSNDVGTLVTVSGIIVSSSSPSIKGSKLSLKCKNCGHIKDVAVKSGFGGVHVPRLCERYAPNQSSVEKCPLDSYVIDPDSTQYIDQQVLKLQETPESIPTGEIPRSFQIYCERNLINRASPGNRVYISGIYTANEQGQALVTKKNNFKETNQKPYIKVLGLQMENKRSGKNIYNFSHEDEQKFLEYSKDPSKMI